jgi:hypothetical protein
VSAQIDELLTIINIIRRLSDNFIGNESTKFLFFDELGIVCSVTDLITLSASTIMTKEICKAFVTEVGEQYFNLQLTITARQLPKFATGKLQRVIATVNGFSFPCALRPIKGSKDMYITLSKDKVKKSKVEANTTVDVMLTPDESEFGFPVPEEFAEYLSQVPETKDMFKKLPAGYQRGFLHYIDSAKTLDTRIKRCIHIGNRIREEFLKRKPK